MRELIAIVVVVDCAFGERFGEIIIYLKIDKREEKERYKKTGGSQVGVSVESEWPCKNSNEPLVCLPPMPKKSNKYQHPIYRHPPHPHPPPAINKHINRVVDAVVCCC